ncbi:hypothetical protein M097_4528 [Phocaeicola vulgatus str. 3775 SL(B) 10 (iv)]|uniref:Uncharacterized protein n=1 Tax=Phocaeicola vulgatus str. 3775 SL(B) 10 (iv) TaxID=1339350 RepID=A0A078QNG5_PHOVU|nr:hypothetical protein M097_4528 [Phocaeicola vulgatus str. 3775 SL(B) 10 (iv)]KDS30957.1 hypothetical protein M098_5126 [Phocaeicola vulgatus str. 3775 SR(B) 19]
MTFSIPIPQKKNNIHINITIRMQAGRSAFFCIRTEKNLFFRF